MRRFTKLKISTRLYSAFALVLALMIALAAFVSYEMRIIEEGVVEYRQIARSTNQIGRIQANFLETRLGVKDFVKTPSDESIAVVEDRIAATNELIVEADKLVTDSQRKSLLDTVRSRIEVYGETFGRVTDLQARRNAIVATMDEVGPRASSALEDLKGSSAAATDGLVKSISFSLGDTALARLHAFKFLLVNDPTQMQLAEDRIRSAITRLEQIRGTIDTSLIEPIIQDLNGYSEFLRQVGTIIGQRNELISGTLDTIGPEVASLIEEMKLDYKATQDRIGPEMQASTELAVNLSIVLTLIALVAGVIAATVVSRSITRPVASLQATMDRLAAGDLEAVVTGTENGDELGSMARSVQVFKENAVEKVRLEAQQKAAEERSRRERRESMHSLADRFESEVGSIVAIVSSAATELQSSSEALTTAINETQTQTSQASSGAGQASENVQTVASAAEEMAASVQEVNVQLAATAGRLKEMTGSARSAGAQMDQLQKAVEMIDDVLAQIGSVADQTNLLALNATIEAARAGDAGKGFAVVANEVKHLAEQTRKMTEVITERLASVKEQSGSVVAASRSMVSDVEQINETTSSISSSLEQQSSTTQMISRNTQEAAQGTESLTKNLDQVVMTARHTSEVSANVNDAANDLARQAASLHTAVQSFLSEVRAA